MGAKSIPENTPHMPKLAVVHTGDTFRTSRDGGLRSHLDAIFDTLGRPECRKWRPNGSPRPVSYKDFPQNLYGDRFSDLNAEIEVARSRVIENTKACSSQREAVHVREVVNPCRIRSAASAVRPLQ